MRIPSGSEGAGLRQRSPATRHIGMRLQHPEQIAGGLSADDPARMTAKAVIVAEATVGFAMLMHMSNGMMFARAASARVQTQTGSALDAKSMMFAAATPPTMVRLTGSTTREGGAAPIVQVSTAPFTTWIDILVPRCGWW